MVEFSDDVRRRKAAGRILAAFSALLLAAAVGLAVWQLWPETKWAVGAVEESWPYRSSAAGSKAASTEVPEGRRLVIPRISVDAKVSGGDPYRAMGVGVYHHVETGEPGDADSVVIAGHRNRRALALLSRLKTGDPVLLYWDGEEHVYRVREKYVTGPDDAAVLAPSDTEELRLYTCLPRFLGDKRTVVVATPETER